MAGICIHFLFFSYVSATIIYLIFGIFASTGNVPLLIEHYHLNAEKTDIEKDEPENVKSRTYSQYYLGSALCLTVSIVLYFFFYYGKKDPKETINQYVSLDLNEPTNEIKNEPIELAQPLDNNNANLIDNNNNEIITTTTTNNNTNIRTINTVEEIGMGEKEI